MNFLKYQHVEKYGNKEVEDINLGICYVFPKIDGTNSSVWLDDNDDLKAGSRNRELSLDNDNAGFYNKIINNKNIINYLKANPTHRLYGEWLVPHTLKTYDNTAWKKFYVFDVTIGDELNYIPYEEYSKYLDEFNVEYIKPIKVIENPTSDDLIDCLKLNTYLITNNGIGEGVVIKNYNFKNCFGRTTWAKIISSEYLEKKAKKGIRISENETMFEIEKSIVDDFVTNALIEKEYSKVVNDNNGCFENKLIPKVLNMVYYCLITEEFWNVLRKFKNPKINFRTLQNRCFEKTREVILSR